MALIGLPSLVAGIILAAAGSHWFSGAVTVGWVLIIFSISWILLVLGAVMLVASTGSPKRRGQRF